jgi:hypothetical protein
MQAVQICTEHDLFEDLFRCYSSLGMLHHRQHDSSKALHILGLALDAASMLEEKIQLSCEIFINKAEVRLKTLRRNEPQHEDLKETSADCIHLNAFMYIWKLAESINLPLCMVEYDGVMVFHTLVVKAGQQLK